jgi:hypothetical protein
MKKSELISIIKSAVREELKTTLPKVLSEVLGGVTEKKVNVEKTEVSVKKTPKLSDKIYSRNDKINEALRQTVGGVPQEGSLVSSNSNFSPNKQVDFNGNELNVDDLPENLASALTRDYSSLLNAIDKKKGSK